MSASARQKEKVVGRVEYLKNFYSKLLNNKRDIFILLPPGYKRNKNKRYPVLYMHDGQNLIDPRISFAGIGWRVDETVNMLIKKKKIKEIIVVGINNTPDRLKEYSDSPAGKNYMKFLIKELKPVIDHGFRTLKNRNDTAVMGSSMGGLISFLLAWNYPGVFSMAGCMSSSFFYKSGNVIKTVKNSLSPKKKIKIYIDSGEDGTLKTQKMFCALTSKGYKIGIDLDYFYDRGAEHNEAAWAERLERPLLFFFGLKQ